MPAHTIKTKEAVVKPSIQICVGSTNPVKVNACRAVFVKAFPEYEIECVALSVLSGVAEQPMTERETRLGAKNRVAQCQLKHQAHYYIAIEGGVDRSEDGAYTCAYVVISNGKQQSVNRSTQLPLPVNVYKALTEGAELGPLMDQLFQTRNIKQKGGAIGLLTNHLASRQSCYELTVSMCLSQFLHPKLYLD